MVDPAYREVMVTNGRVSGICTTIVPVWPGREGEKAVEVAIVEPE
jgi:hypothetical protein